MNYDFVDDGKSVSVNAGGVVDTLPKNQYLIRTTDIINQNKVLYIDSVSTDENLYTIDLNVDTITGVGAGSTTADQLKTALTPIFFLDSSGAGIPDAPSDGQLYGRKDGAWDVVTAGLEFQDYPISQPAWSGNTDYESTVTFTGAALGDTFAVGVSEGVEVNLDNAGAVSYSNAYATGVDTVKIRGRISSYINIPAGSIIRLIKLV